MNQSPKLSWSEIVVLGLLAFGLILDLGANARSLLDSLYALGFLAFIFFAAWLRKWTIRKAPPKEPNPPTPPGTTSQAPTGETNDGNHGGKPSEMVL
jgi:hypothetical protein